MSPWHLTPEHTLHLAQDTVTGVLGRVRTLTGPAADPLARTDSPDAVEELMLQLKLAAAHLAGAARQLREVEQQRRLLAHHQQQTLLRFEPDAWPVPHLMDRMDDAA